MLTEIGYVEAIFRYPVKSMRGEPLEVATPQMNGSCAAERLVTFGEFRRGGLCVLFQPRPLLERPYNHG
jgi:hypothetical protein